MGAAGTEVSEERSPGWIIEAAKKNPGLNPFFQPRMLRSGRVEDGGEAPQPSPILEKLYEWICLTAFGVHWVLAFTLDWLNEPPKKK